ncbi:MAG: histidinol-phosphatase HisJ family protein [Porcipelethomonas sp.]
MQFNVKKGLRLLIIDCHTHTHNSVDGHDTVHERCLNAIQLGLDAMAVTDHCEANRFYEKEHYSILIPKECDDYNYQLYFKNSMDEIHRAKEDFDGKLNLICGVELGQATADLQAAQKILSDSRLDFVIGSMHELPGRDDFAFLKYSADSVYEILDENFSEILKLAKWNGFDVLGHLTYTLRYIQGEQGIKVDLSRYDDIIAEIFRIIINNGKGIEINTSGLRQKYGYTFPAYNYIKLYRELGGEIITVGSDSHTTADLGKGIAEGIALAQKAGFRYIAYFKNRKPEFLKIK